MFKGLLNKDKAVVAGEDARENYLKLHSSPGYIRLLCFTVFTLVRDPHIYVAHILKLFVERGRKYSQKSG